VPGLFTNPTYMGGDSTAPEYSEASSPAGTYGSVPHNDYNVFNADEAEA